jgi:hypothetical protein
MKAVETRAWRFETPPSDDCEVRCPDGECAAWSPLTAWTVEDLECETCGEHDAMQCPVCGWLHDHVHSGLTPLKVRAPSVTHHE